MSRFFVILIATMALAACGPKEETARSGKTISAGTADIGGAFSLIDETGSAVSEVDLMGKPHLIYFGFTYCPDVCPMALQRMAMAQDLLKEDGGKIGYVLISVDPERDTPESLSQYISADVFPKGLRGFTGSLEQIDTAKAAYKVFAQKTVLPDSASEYTVDHSDIMYLMNKDGKFADYFHSGSTPNDIAARVRQHLKTGR